MIIEPPHVWVPGAAAPGSGDGGRIGALPQPGKSPPSSAASHACPGRARGWELGLVPGQWGDVPSHPPLPAPHPRGRPGDAPGGTSSLLPAKRIGFLDECEKAPAEPIPAAISDNKALY